jgi:elongation factor P
MAAANDLRKGMAIRYHGDVAVVLDVQHRTPGNLRAFVQANLRSIRTGKSSNVRFSSTETVELIDVNRRKLEYSYKDQDGYVFMDPESYETETFPPELINEAADYLTENLAVDVLFAEGKAVEVELPSSVVLKVVESAEGAGETRNRKNHPGPFVYQRGRGDPSGYAYGRLHGPRVRSGLSAISADSIDFLSPARWNSARNL